MPRYLMDFAEWFVIMFSGYIDIVLGTMVACALIGAVIYVVGRFLSSLMRST